MASKVLVTGGAGYIGAHTCKALAHAGFTPVTYDNFSRGHRDFVRFGPLLEGDLLDTERLTAALQEHQPLAVMHFAAFAYVGESVFEPERYFHNNVQGSLSLLRAMRACKLDKLVFSSTCATYGELSVCPVPEEHPQQPINPYGQSKLMVERMLRDFSRAYGLRSIALRYFNAAGADPDAELGEDHRPEPHLIPLILDVAQGRQAHLTILGEDYATPDGSCIRDYIHVSDLADAHVLALNALLHGAETTAYNLGNGKGYSVKEVVACAEAVTSRRVAVEVGARRPGDPAMLVGDARRFIRDHGWLPRHADLPSIIASAWRWHQGLPKRRGQT
jgi:UDP-arabinose 4-epimerase